MGCVRVLIEGHQRGVNAQSVPGISVGIKEVPIRLEMTVPLTLAMAGGYHRLSSQRQRQLTSKVHLWGVPERGR